jgi:hypothetical protein
MRTVSALLATVCLVGTVQAWKYQGHILSKLIISFQNHPSISLMVDVSPSVERVMMHTDAVLLKNF